MQACFLPADILLPSGGVDCAKWAVIACDQFTSQPEYWREAERIVGDSPSALEIIYPEAYLSQGDARIRRIREAMTRDLENGTLVRRVTDGFVLVRRATHSGERLGLVGRLDLEQYDYTPGTDAPVRATEGTILSRIPPRVRIRRGAPIESPHVMLLLDDPAMRLIEPLADRAADLPLLYDVELMLGGGRLTGYAVEGGQARRTAEQIAQMQRESGGFFLAVGDGNHSLATAKACWEEIRPTLSPQERACHPARFALVEVVNLHSPALIFRPIHRVVFSGDMQGMIAALEEDVRRQGMALVPGEELVFAQEGVRCGLDVSGRGGRLPVDVLQRFLDAQSGLRMDYVHGEADALSLTEGKGAFAILLGAIDKHSLFGAIAAGGVLPRKTFSMGESTEKRYYMECRRIGMQAEEPSARPDAGDETQTTQKSAFESEQRR